MSKDLATGIGIACLAVIVCALVPMAGVIGSVFIPVPLIVFRANERAILDQLWTPSRPYSRGIPA